METYMEYFLSRPLESTDRPNTFPARHKLFHSFQLRARGCLLCFQKSRLRQNLRKYYFWKHGEKATVSVGNDDAISRVELLNNPVYDIDFGAIME